MTPPGFKIRPSYEPWSRFLDWDFSSPQAPAPGDHSSRLAIAFPGLETHFFSGASLWRTPGLFRPFPSLWGSPPLNPTTASSSASPPSGKGFSLRDFVVAIESMDLTLSGMDANGGVEGCRYSEVVPIEKLPKAKCQNKFKKGTKATARIEIRPLEGMNVSELYRLYVNYDKHPGRTGITVGGFFISHPLNPADQGPLDAPQEDPFEGGKDFRQAVKGQAEVAMGNSVPYSEESSDLVMRPQGWLYDSSALADFDITKGTLMASGLVDKKIYKDLGIPSFQIPRRLDKLWDLLSKADTCYPKRPGAKVAQPNFLNDKPPLIQWAAPENIELDVTFRPNRISLGDLGYLELGDQGTNKIKVRGDDKQTLIEIELKDIRSLNFLNGEYGLTAKNLKVGKLVLSLPPLKEIAKEMGWLDQKKAEDVIQACLGNAPAGGKKDNSAYLQKILAKVELQDLHADSLEFSQKSRGVLGTLEGADIRSLQLLELKNLDFHTVSAKTLTLQDPLTQMMVTVEQGSIAKLSLRQGDAGPVVQATDMLSDSIKINRKEAAFQMDAAEIKKFSLDFSEADRMEFLMEQAKAKGSVDFKDDLNQVEFKSRGKGAISLFKIQGEKRPDGWSDLHGEVNFSGTIEELSLVNAKTGHFKLKDTVLGESRFTFGIKPDDQGLHPEISLQLAAEHAEIEKGHINFVDIGASSLENGKIALGRTDQGLNLSLEGTLDLGFPEVDIPPIEALAKGFKLEGALKDIRISGSGRLEVSPQEVKLNKSADDPDATLAISGKFMPLHFQDTPAERSSKLKKSLAGKVVQTDVQIDSALIEVKDLEEFYFQKGKKDEGIKPELKRLKVSQFSITDIQAGGRIWAKFPIFGWLMGKFPEIGKVFKDKDPVPLTSEIGFESLDTHLAADGRYTELKNLSIQLFEVGGRKQWAKFRMPLLNISPDSIQTGKDPIELEVYFKDKDRGGDFKFELKDEDLTGRKRRKAK